MPVAKASSLKTPNGKQGQLNRKKTYHQGANDERTAVLAKIRRAKKGFPNFSPTKLTLDNLENWLLWRNERYKRNPGGL